MWRLLLGLSVMSVVSAETLRFQPHSTSNTICPDRQGSCPSGTTCCLLQSGKYGCCPLPEATCCEDHVHCCPSAYRCDPTSGSCYQGNKTVAMVAKHEATPLIGRNSECGGDSGVKYECPDGMTCCRLKSGEWACCPLPQAVCCADGVHCCPSGYTCNKRTGSCQQAGNSNPLLTLRPSHKHMGGATNNESSSGKHSDVKMTKPLTRKRRTCPGGKSYCDGGKTCCYKDKWHFNCCPFVNGVCCNDTAHCCPLGYNCNVKLGKCTKGGAALPWGQTERSSSWTEEEQEPKEGILPVGGDYVECPDEESRCPDGATCCLLSSGQYGCCPLKKAVCCADHLHCCPAGTTCDPKDETCKKGDLAIPWHTKVSALPRLNMSNSTKCADEKTTCPDQTTCCAMLDGYYACCPFPNAKCCADKLHCCPSKEECDVKRGKCVAPKGQSPWVNHAPAPKVVSPVSNRVICPDGKECPADNTCCQISVGLFGCCPLKQAVCCSDHTHCCPRGYACDITAGTCTSSANGATISWYTKTEAQPRAVGTVICPDKESFCPEHTTCCLLSTKQYGCCPLPQAICCSDGVHCCPSGYTCDVKKSSCQKSTDSIPWSEKIPAEPLTYGGQWVTCPDKKSQCQDGQTCCMQQSGVFGCCPLPKAVCCSDRLHCCPEQSTCDVHAGTCSSKTNSLTISWSSIRRSSAHVPTQEQEETICEDKTRCPSGSTCCMMKSGVYGCCPYNKGVCCSDEMRCCPESFHCDKTSRRCDKIDSSLSLTSTLFTRFKPVPETRSWGGPPVVKCPGGKEKCPKGSTCCKQPSGRYGCCRYDNAVCCPDGVSCCPQGYACDVQSGTCTQSKSIPWLAKVPATHIPTVQDRAMAVKCPDKVHQCPDGSTCCKLSSGDWGCCPVPEAVCCRDGLHCCPQGYTCDPPTGACTQHTDHSKALPFLTLAASNRATSKP